MVTRRTAQHAIQQLHLQAQLPTEFAFLEILADQATLTRMTLTVTAQTLHLSTTALLLKTELG